MKTALLTAALLIAASAGAQETSAPAKRRKPAASKALKPVPKPGLKTGKGISTFAGPASSSARAESAPLRDPSKLEPKPLKVEPNSEPAAEKKPCAKAKCFWTLNPKKDPLQPNICVEACPKGTAPEPLEPPLPAEWGAPGMPGHRACGCVVTAR